MFSNDDLIFEMSERGYTCLADDEYLNLLKDEEECDVDVSYGSSGFPQVFSVDRMRAFGNDLREHLLEITGQGHYVTNEQLLNELRNLL